LNPLGAVGRALSEVIGWYCPPRFTISDSAALIAFANATACNARSRSAWVALSVWRQLGADVGWKRRRPICACGLADPVTDAMTSTAKQIDPFFTIVILPVALDCMPELACREAVAKREMST
jgi:hypothetical protein